MATFPSFPAKSDPFSLKDWPAAARFRPFLDPLETQQKHPGQESSPFSEHQKWRKSDFFVIFSHLSFWMLEDFG